MSNASSRCSNGYEILQVLVEESEERPPDYFPEFIILGHSLQSHAVSMV